MLLKRGSKTLTTNAVYTGWFRLKIGGKRQTNTVLPITMMDSSNLDSAALMDVIENKMSKFTGGEIFISQKYWSEGIAVIFINHPEKKNAITGRYIVSTKNNKDIWGYATFNSPCASRTAIDLKRKMMIDFRRCVEQLENWPDGKAILLTGVGENFCSGGDLDFARKCGTPEDGFNMSYLMQDVLKRFKKLPLFSLALIHGPTLGGGAEITVACDFVIASDNVKFGFVHAKMGIMTAWGGTTGLVQKLGKDKALDLLLTAKLLNAEECLNIGLATEIVKNANKMEEALEWLRYRTTFHYSIARSFKQACMKASESTMEESFEYERRLFCPTWGSEENKKILEKKINHLKDAEKNKSCTEQTNGI